MKLVGKERLLIAPLFYPNKNNISGQTISEVLEMAKQNQKHAKKNSSAAGSQRKEERPISTAYPVIDNDLARDNIENDSPAANLQDI